MPEQPLGHFDSRLNNRRGIQLLKGRVEFENSDTVRVHDCEVSHIKFRHAILATGSQPIPYPKTTFETGGRIISSTDPQIAWCGMTEEQACAENRKVKVQRFPWKFSGRAATMGAPEGLTKIIVDPETGRILGLGITGRDTEGLISEGLLAIEMGALAEDMALSIHPHPTLSETEGEAAELFLGSATHILSGSRHPKNDE